MTKIVFRRSLAAVFVCCGALLATPAMAQQDTAATDTGSGGIGPADQASVGIVEADTSMFTLDRGDTIGAAAEGGGFGIGAETNAGGGGAGGGGFGGGGFGGGGLGGLFGGLFGGGGQGAQSAKPTIRVRLRSAVNVAPLQPTAVAASATRRLSAIQSNQAYPSVNVTMQGRTAVLTGSVQSDRDRRMSQLLMSMEPGVSRVENRLNVNGR